MTQTVKTLPAMQETQVRSLGQEDLLEKEIAVHSSILAWRIPWMEEPGGLPYMGSQRSDTTEQLTHNKHSCGLWWQVPSNTLRRNNHTKMKKKRKLSEENINRWMQFTMFKGKKLMKICTIWWIIRDKDFKVTMRYRLRNVSRGHHQKMCRQEMLEWS